VSLRLAVAGCGRVFERFHLPALRSSKDWTVVAACDPLPARRTWIAEMVPGSRVYATMPEMLAATPADAVLVASPPEMHADLALEALAAGMHVLVEKPLALHVEHARAVVRAAEAARRTAWTGFVRRFRASYLDLRRHVQGQPTGWDTLHSELVVDAGAGVLGGFQGDDARGGGVLDDVASHQLDLVEWLAGTPIVAVRGLSWDTGAGRERVRFEVRWSSGKTAQVLSGSGGRAIEHVVVSVGPLTYFAHPAGLLRMPGRAPRWTRRAAAVRTRAHFVSRRLLRRENATALAFRGQLEAFGQAVRGVPVAAGADAAAGLRSLEATLALRQSFRQGGGWTSLG
jgi:predicted dehydrogenase